MVIIPYELIKSEYSITWLLFAHSKLIQGFTNIRCAPTSVYIWKMNMSLRVICTVSIVTMATLNLYGINQSNIGKYIVSWKESNISMKNVYTKRIIFTVLSVFLHSRLPAAQRMLFVRNQATFRKWHVFSKKWMSLLPM